MHEDELRKQLKEFPQHQRLDEDKKEEMKHTLRKEVGKEAMPFQKRKRKPWIAGIVGVAALMIMIFSVLAITGGQPLGQANFTGENGDQSLRAAFIKEVEENEDITDYSFSPDEKEVLFVEVENEILMVKFRDLESNTTKSLFQAPSIYHEYSWSPNGRYAMYASSGISPKKSWMINLEKAKVQSMSPFYRTGSPLWGEYGNRVVFGEDHPDRELSRIVMYDFEKMEAETLYTARKELVRYYVEKWETNKIKVMEDLLEEERSRPILLSKENNQWTSLEEMTEEDAEPGTKAHINQKLRTQQQVQIENITWSPDESYVVYTESTFNAPDQRTFIWEVGKTDPQAIKNDFEENVHTLKGFKWNEDSTHFIELYSYGGDNKFLWTVVDAEEEIRTKQFPATHEPKWSPGGNRIAYVEGIREEKESGTISYNALKVYGLSPDRMFDSSGNQKFRIQTLFESEEFAQYIEVKSWRDRSSIEATYRSYMANGKSTMLFNEVNGEWKRDRNIPINLMAFSTPIYFGRHLVKEEPYSLWDEETSKEVVLGNDKKIIVSLYNANGVEHVFLRYRDRWFSLQETKFKNANISTEPITGNENNEIVILGTEVQEGEEIPIKHIIRFKPDDQNANNFEHIAAIPYYQEVDLDGDSNSEMVSIHESQVFIYVTDNNQMGKINVLKAVGAKSHQTIELKKVDDQYIFEIRSEKTGEVDHYKFADFELYKTELEG
ncbi:PD40 domain-containing protein [Pontibacillus sp. HMF3514]|uniref:PD40 domain-containing protein n=1 Tax=Pontibacillus sp. HMF3514 TaxID=2692425 RepID=UPI00131FDC85|nr:PD40 domain-containing protein [Pontibacillus sp. HMF3514]QHE50784.1 hypothetical protein GS400_01340 [Pontibacillus sp. HMF3514]